jgi:hypothetical protein
VRAAGRGRLSGALLAVAVSVVALSIGAGLLVALRGSSVDAGRSAGGAPRTLTPHTNQSSFPGAPRSSRGQFTSRGQFVCRPAPRNRYLPRNAGCVSVLRADMTGGGRTDLVLLYADLSSRRVKSGYETAGFTLEVVQPGGAIARTQVQADPFPDIDRVGNINGVPGDELVLHLDDVSSGDTYGIYSFHSGAVTLVRPLLSAGGDSADKEGFACSLSLQPRLVVRVMTMLGPTIRGRWRWTVITFRWEPDGLALHRVNRRKFVRRGLPAGRDIAAGPGCGRASGATQSNQ